MGIIGKAAGVVTSFFGVRKPPQGKPPVMEGTIVIARSRRQGTTTITSTVAGAADFLRQEALKQGAAVEERGAGLVVVFKGDVRISWPRTLLPFVAHAQESPWAITKSVAGVVLPKTLPGSVSSSPFSLSGDATVQPPVVVVAETPIRNPVSVQSGEVIPERVGRKIPIDSPISLGGEESETVLLPHPEVGKKGRPIPSPWVPNEEIDTHYPPGDRRRGS